MRLCVVAFAFLVAATAAGQVSSTSTLADVFEASNVAASRGEMRNAISGYRTLIEAGVRDADVYFNLATVFAQSGDYARAILNYERALALRPNDARIQGDLAMAEQALEEARAEAEGEATIERSSSMSDALYSRFTEDALAYALLAADFWFFGCLAWAWASRRRGAWLVASSVAAALLLSLSAAGLAVKAGMLREGPRAVALDDRVPLREGPDQQARVRGEARGGDRVVVVARDRDFVKLRVIGGLEGWVPASAVGLIDVRERLH